MSTAFNTTNLVASKIDTSKCECTFLVRIAGPTPLPPPPLSRPCAAAHSALDGPVLSIEGARTYAPSISMGAVAVFVRFSPGWHRQERERRRARGRWGELLTRQNKSSTVSISLS